MILTDREIAVALKEGMIIVDPLPQAQAFSSTSLDLTLHSKIREWNDPPAGVEQICCPADPGFRFNILRDAFTKEIDISSGGYVLKPNELILAWTNEFIKLPACQRIAARVEGKSSLARLGLSVHQTAPTIHAGFEGNVQLEIINLGRLRVRLNTGMPVCQLIFEQTTGTPEKGYQGQFFKQIATTANNSA